jgi:hypothetical protein
MGVDIQGPLASVYRLAIGKEAQDAFNECVPLFKKCAEEEAGLIWMKVGR